MRKKNKMLMLPVIGLATMMGFNITNVNAASIGSTGVNVNYQAHVENIGWQASVSNGAVAGTTGRALRIEALNMSLSGLPSSVKVHYNVHSQNVGWTGWRTSGNAGTTGQALRAEAVSIYVEGLKEQGYDLQYRAHVQNIGWQGWVTAGESANLNSFAGTTGQALRVEAVQIRLVENANMASAKAKLSSKRASAISTLSGLSADNLTADEVSALTTNAINRINTMTDTNPSIVDEMISAIDNLVETTKSNVETANATKLEEAKTAAEEAIAQAKEEALATNPTLEDTLDEIASETAIDNMKNATTVADVNSAKEEILGNITAAVELEEAKIDAVGEIMKACLDAINVNSDLEDTLDEIVSDDVIDSIDNATTVADVNSVKEEILADITEAVNSFKTNEWKEYVESLTVLNTVVPDTDDNDATTEDPTYLDEEDITDAIEAGYETVISDGIEAAKADLRDAIKNNVMERLEAIYNDGKGKDNEYVSKDVYDKAINVLENKDAEFADMFDAYKTAFDSRKSIDDLKAKAVQDLKDTLGTTNLDTTSQYVKIVEKLAVKAINRATDSESVAGALEDGKAALLDAAKEVLLDTLEEQKENGTITNDAYDKAIEDLEDATTIEVAVEKATVSNKDKDLVTAINTAMDKIDAYIETLGDYADIATVNTAIDTAKKAILGETNKDDVATLETTQEGNIFTTLKNYIEGQLSQLNTLGIEEDDVVYYITDAEYSNVNSTITSLTSADKTSDLIVAYEGIEKLTKAAYDLASTKANAVAKLDKIDLDNYQNHTDNQDAVKAAIATAKEAIEAATTKQEVVDAVATAQAAIAEIETDAQITDRETSSEQLAQEIAKYAGATTDDGKGNVTESENGEIDKAIKAAVATALGYSTDTTNTDEVAAINAILANDNVASALTSARATIRTATVKSSVKDLYDAEMAKIELVIAKEVSKSSLDTYAKTKIDAEATFDDDTKKGVVKASLASVITEYSTKIDAAEDKDAITALVTEAEEKIDAKVKDAKDNYTLLKNKQDKIDTITALVTTAAVDPYTTIADDSAVKEALENAEAEIRKDETNATNLDAVATAEQAKVELAIKQAKAVIDVNGLVTTAAVDKYTSLAENTNIKTTVSSAINSINSATNDTIDEKITDGKNSVNLVIAREKAIIDIDNLVSADVLTTKYASVANEESVINAVKAAKEGVNASTITTADGVTAAYNDGKTAIDAAVAAAKQDIDNAIASEITSNQNTAKSQLEAYYNLVKDSDDTTESIKAKYDAGVNDIEAETDADEITKALEAAKIKILAQTKSVITTALGDKYDNGDFATDSETGATTFVKEADYNSAKATIDGIVVTKEATDEKIQTIVNAYTNVTETSVETYLQEQLDEFNTYIARLDDNIKVYSSESETNIADGAKYSSIDTIKNTYENLETTLAAKTSESEVTTLMTNTKSAVLEATRTYAKKQLDNMWNANYTPEYGSKVMDQSAYNLAKKSTIPNAETIGAIIDAYNAAVATIS